MIQNFRSITSRFASSRRKNLDIIKDEIGMKPSATTQMVQTLVDDECHDDVAAHFICLSSLSLLTSSPPHLWVSKPLKFPQEIDCNDATLLVWKFISTLVSMFLHYFFNLEPIVSLQCLVFENPRTHACGIRSRRYQEICNKKKNQ